VSKKLFPGNRQRAVTEQTMTTSTREGCLFYKTNEHRCGFRFTTNIIMIFSLYPCPASGYAGST